MKNEKGFLQKYISNGAIYSQYQKSLKKGDKLQKRFKSQPRAIPCTFFTLVTFGHLWFCSNFDKAFLDIWQFNFCSGSSLIVKKERINFLKVDGFMSQFIRKILRQFTRKIFSRVRQSNCNNFCEPIFASAVVYMIATKNQEENMKKMFRFFDINNLIV